MIVRMLPVAACLAAVLSSSLARADDPVAPAETDWEARTKEVELRTRYEEAVYRQERNRQRYEEEQRGEEARGPQGIEQRKLLLPELASVTYARDPFGGGFGAFVGPVHYASISDGVHNTTAFGVSLSADEVVERRWTIGGGVDVARMYGNGPYEESNSLQGAVDVRGGLLVPLGRGVSLWPRLGFGLSRTRSERTGKGAASGQFDQKKVDMGTTLRPAASLAIVFPLTRLVFFRVEQTVSYWVHSVEEQDDTTDTVHVGGLAALGVSL